MILNKIIKISSDLDELYINTIISESKHYTKKGFRLFFKDVAVAFTGDDFARNLFTVRYRYICYKKPRFIK